MSKVICLSGKAGCGKDTVAGMMTDILREQGYSVHIISYAGVLKYICKEHLGWNGQKDEAGRSLLQKVGTDIIRAKNQTFFVEFVLNLLTFFGDWWDYVIIPDCRFKNEIGHLRMNGIDVTHFYVNRRNMNSKLNAEQQSHPSETEMDGVMPDFYINNYAGLPELEKTVRTVVMEDLL